MKKYSLYNKDIFFELTSSKQEVSEGDSFTVTITATGTSATEGFEIPYRVGAKDKGETLRVSPSDFNKEGEYGIFKLNSSLQDTIEVHILEDKYKEEDEVCFVTLMLRPEVAVEVKVINKFFQEEIPVEKPKPLSQKIDLKAVSHSVKEGTFAEFLVTYENIRVGSRVDYEYLDSKDDLPITNYFTVSDSGFSIIKIEVEDIQNISSNFRILNIWIKDYPKVRASSIVSADNLIDGKMEGIYNPGYYDLVAQPGVKYRVVLVAGGGGGGAGVHWYDQDAIGISGVNGKSSQLFASDTLLTQVEGGGGGQRGYWDNGSAWVAGEAGVGGGSFLNQTNYITKVYGIKEGKKGDSARHAHKGGASVSPVGSYGKGGDSGLGIDKKGYGYPGAGGSGGCTDFVLENTSIDTSLLLKLTVGSGGLGGKVPTERFEGKNGVDGVCIITREE